MLDQDDSVILELGQFTDYEIYELMDYYKSIDESSIENDTRITNNYNIILEEALSRYNKLNIIRWPYSESPYFTDREVYSLLNENLLMSNSTKNIMNNEKSYQSRINELENKLKQTDDPVEIYELKSKLIALGWNPEFEYSNSLFKSRIEMMYTNEIHNCIFMESRIDLLPKIENNNISIKHVWICPTEGSFTINENDIINLSSSKDSIIEQYSFIYKTKSFNESEFLSSIDQLRILISYYPFPLPPQVIAHRIFNALETALDYKEKAIIFKVREDTLDNFIK